MSFASTITVPHHRPDQARALWEQLVQDGFTNDELRVPPIASDQFVTLVQDAHHFSKEVGDTTQAAWPLRCERWLNQVSTILTGKLFAELPMPKRRAICHAAFTLAGRPELLS